ncbi:hypothetical protein ETD86_37340 [Nonomuraea turkmeniaca]|uniref:Uncharacterized protein n=1 Tax=Nonomuraea turkmeniaca TaxID=103838 RepID=A0A5S4F496_9ACTN|nr:hypothetical protein [Nonomuraea turkmeniaca]TMR10983.1 hypothetical protein ETD86_37340 [Nonomuraea turkmeniaca]
MIDHDRPHDLDDHAALATEDDAGPRVAQFQPNRISRGIMAKLEAAGFAVRVPAAPHGASWALTLYNAGCPWDGVLYVSKQKGRALRITLTWHPPRQAHQTRRAEGAHAIHGLLRQFTPDGWKTSHA